MTITATQAPDVTDQMRVWIGCFACYNDGRLTGQWYPALEARDVTTKQLHAAEGIATDDAGYVRGQEGYGPHEELWCFDTEAPFGLLAGEMSPARATDVAETVQDCIESLHNCPPEAYLAYWREGCHGDLQAAANAADDMYISTYDSFRDYADEIADADITNIASCVEPSHPNVWSERGLAKFREETEDRLRRYFHWQAHADDLEHYYTVIRHENGVWIFHA